MIWPTALIEELASRRCIIFIGSGVSATATDSNGIHPPTWKDLLVDLKSNIVDRVAISQIESYLDKEKYLDAAEIISNNILVADFYAIIRKNTAGPRFSPSSIHENLLYIDPKIVITTNYDEIYENYCRTGDAQNGYSVVKYYDTNLIDGIRSPNRLIIKVHGCISNPASIILSRSKYFEERQRYQSFYNVLSALFISNTLLFIGYSLNDPDIQLLLENSNIFCQGTIPHYCLIPDTINTHVLNAMKRAYNIDFIKFTNYDEVSDGIKELKDRVIAFRGTNP